MKLLMPIELYYESLKRSGPLLGLCVGNKIVDFSISDRKKEVAEPFTRLLRIKKTIGSVADIRGLIYGYSASGLVIGYPSEREKSSPITGVEVRRFIDDITKKEKLEDVNYTFWEQTFKSKIIEPTLKPLELDPLQDTTFVDRFASMKILQEYLDYINGVLYSKEHNFVNRILHSKENVFEYLETG